MTVHVRDPNGRDWAVRRTLLRGRDDAGRRWRWRGPDPAWLNGLRVVELLDFASIPVIGVVIAVLVAIPVVAIVLVFLPFVVIGLLEALVLGAILVGLAAAATLVGRPILVRAEAAHDPDERRVWPVKGWRQSRHVRDEVAAAIRSGADLDHAVADSRPPTGTTVNRTTGPTGAG